MVRGPRLRCTLFLVAFAFATMIAKPVPAAVLAIGPDEKWFELLNGDKLQPGDVVELAGGTYRDPRRLSLRHRGTR